MGDLAADDPQSKQQHQDDMTPQEKPNEAAVEGPSDTNPIVTGVNNSNNNGDDNNISDKGNSNVSNVIAPPQQSGGTCSAEQSEGVCHPSSDVAHDTGTTYSFTKQQSSSSDITKTSLSRKVSKVVSLRPATLSVPSVSLEAVMPESPVVPPSTTTGEATSAATATATALPAPSRMSSSSDITKTSLSRKVSKVVPLRPATLSVSPSLEAVMSESPVVPPSTTTGEATGEATSAAATAAAATDALPPPAPSRTTSREYNRPSRYGRKVEQGKSPKDSSFYSGSSGRLGDSDDSEGFTSGSNIVRLEPSRTVSVARTTSTVSASSTGVLSTLQRQEQKLFEQDKISGSVSGRPDSSGPSSSASVEPPTNGGGSSVALLGRVYGKDRSDDPNLDPAAAASMVSPGAYRVTTTDSRSDDGVCEDDMDDEEEFVSPNLDTVNEEVIENTGVVARPSVKQESALGSPNGPTFVADPDGPTFVTNPDGPDKKKKENTVHAQAIDEADLEAEFKDRFLKDVAVAEVHNFELENEVIEEMKLVAARSKRRANRLCAFILALVIALAVGLGVGLNGKKAPPTEAPTPAPTLTPYWSLRELVSPYSSDQHLDNETSAQAMAIEWLLNDDPAQLMTVFPKVPDWTLLERYVMAVLYYSTNGQNWTENEGCLSEANVCEWMAFNSTETELLDKVECNEDGQIVYLRITNNGMNGTIPSELSALSYLEIMSFPYNALAGTIPTQVATLPRLEVLQVNKNLLTGTLPNELASMSTLQILNVYANQMTGTIPASLLSTPLYGLQILDLGFNSFQGTLPLLRDQSPLEVLYLDFNQLTGPLPQSIFAQHNLQVIGLSGNNFNGTLGQEVAGWKNLMQAFMDRNQFSGMLPSQFGLLDNLQELYLEGNALVGTLPPELSDIERLERLDLSLNQLEGTIASALGSFRSLKFLSIADNKKLRGGIPSTFAQMTSLGTLIMTGTNITSGLQEGFCTEPSLGIAIVADCGGESPTIECDCCTSCCGGGSAEDAGSSCTVNVTATCEVKGGQYEQDAERGAVCTCTEKEDSAQVVSCTDTTCETCNLQESECVVNTDYGYHLNGTTGDVIAFENTMVHTKGKWNGTRLTYYAPITEETCDFYVNGMKCDTCFVTICPSDFEGFQIYCENLEGLTDPDGFVMQGYNFHSCVKGGEDAGYLKILDTHDPSLLTGCSPKLEKIANSATAEHDA